MPGRVSLSALALIVAVTGAAGYFTTSFLAATAPGQPSASAPAQRAEDVDAERPSGQADRSVAAPTAIAPPVWTVKSAEFSDDMDGPSDRTGGDPTIDEGDLDDWRKYSGVIVDTDIALTEKALADPLRHLPDDLQRLAQDAIGLEVSYDVGGVAATTSIEVNGTENVDLPATIASAVDLYNARITQRTGSVVPASAANYRLTALLFPTAMTVDDQP